MIRAVFFDLDGTLLASSTGVCSQRTKDALFRLKAQGILVCAATGRSPYEFELSPMIEGLPFDAIVAMNGLYCFTPREVIAQTLFDKADLALLIQKVTDWNYPCVIVKKDDLYINFMNDHVRQAHASIHSPLPRVGDFTSTLQEDVIMTMVYHPAGVDMGQQLQNLHHSHATRWHPYSVDIVPAGCSKKTGIDQVLKKFGIGWEEVMAFGDGENDYEMLKHAHIGVAMGNGDPILLNGDFYITDTSDRDGVVAALEHFHMIERSDK